jgi:putative sigma-54 modulation protein
MKIDYTSRNVHLDDRLKDFVEGKLNKLVKFIEEPVEVRLLLEVEKRRHIAELHCSHRLGALHTKESADSSVFDAISLAIEKAEHQAQRAAEKRIDQRRRNGHRWPVEVLDRESVGSGGPPRIVESTHLPIKPMTIEEAAIELDESAEGFVVFRDAASDRLNVLYRRKDNNYGLIAPDER